MKSRIYMLVLSLLTVLTACIDFKEEQGEFCRRHPATCAPGSAMDDSGTADIEDSGTADIEDSGTADIEDSGTADAGKAQPPYFTEVPPSSSAVGGDRNRTFRVSAEDPQGSALRFSWSVDIGTMEVPEVTSTTSEASWTPPFCVTSGGSASFTVTVTNDLGLSAATHFVVTGISKCQSWSSTGEMTTGRNEHTATLLPSGKVLVVGGCCTDNGIPHELYDPSTGTWSSTGASTIVGSGHTATLLPSGKVLVEGGLEGGYPPPALYDPDTGTSTPITRPGGGPRWDNTATLLASGKVLAVAGRSFGADPVTFVELYDPTAGTWSTTGSLAQYRHSHTATLLPSSGRVLVVGGSSRGFINRPEGGPIATCEVYRPETGTWSTTEALAQARVGHTATLLLTGKVLVTGGASETGARLTSSELYDPVSGTWSATGSLTTGRSNHTATLLPSGKVLVTGGTPDLSSEMYDPASATWSATGNLTTARDGHSATLLPSGKVLVTGGRDRLRSAEVFTP